MSLEKWLTLSPVQRDFARLAGRSPTGADPAFETEPAQRLERGEVHGLIYYFEPAAANELRSAAISSELPAIRRCDCGGIPLAEPGHYSDTTWIKCPKCSIRSTDVSSLELAIWLWNNKRDMKQGVYRPL